MKRTKHEQAFSNQIAESRVKVRYAETDQMGVVYYANYLIWFEVGRSQYCNDRGFSYRDMERETGLFLIVAEASCRLPAISSSSRGPARPSFRGKGLRMNSKELWCCEACIANRE